MKPGQPFEAGEFLSVTLRRLIVVTVEPGEQCQDGGPWRRRQHCPSFERVDALAEFLGVDPSGHSGEQAAGR